MPRIRDYGDGTVRQRKDGRYEGRLMSHGKRIYVYGRSRREVQDKLKAEKRNRDLGIIPTGKETVGSFLEKWLTDTVEPAHERTTFLSYRQQVTAHLVPEIGRVKLDQLSPMLVQRLLNKKRSEGLSPRTVEYIRAIGRQAFNVAIRWRMVNWNPFALAEVDHPKRGHVTYFTVEQAVQLLDTAKGSRAYPIYCVALTTGMRQGELFGLRWTDVDWGMSTLTVRAALKRAEGDVWLGTPKTEQSQATLPLTPLALRALAEWREQQKKDRYRAGPPFADLVFTTLHGLPLTARNFTRRTYYPTLERAGLPRIPFRNLRHSCGTLLRALGVDIKVIQAILRHSKIATTADYYVEVMMPGMREAVDGLGRLLGG